MTKIPYDIYESDYEVVIILPLWWVKKESLSIRILHETLYISWQREQPVMRDDFTSIKQECFRWPIDCAIDLPPESNYKNMSSNLSKENILSIIIPKNSIPDHIDIIIEE